MSYETNDEITMDAYIEEKLNTKLPKLFFLTADGWQNRCRDSCRKNND